jgi:hypothetical protein
MDKIQGWAICLILFFFLGYYVEITVKTQALLKKRWQIVCVSFFLKDIFPGSLLCARNLKRRGILLREDV